MNKLLIVLSVATLLLTACGKPGEGKGLKSASDQQLRIKEAKIKSITATEYKYNDAGELDTLNVLSKEDYKFDSEGRCVEQIMYYGANIPVVKTEFVYNESDALPIEEKVFDDEVLKSRKEYRSESGQREATEFDSKNSVIAKTIYFNDSLKQEEIRYYDADKKIVDYKKIWQYDNQKRVVLFVVYNGEDSIKSKKEVSYDEFGIKESTSYGRSGVLTEKVVRVVADKNKVQVEGQCVDGSKKYNYTEVMDEKGKVVQTIFDSLIGDHYADKRVKYNDKGLKTEVTTYNRSGKPESVLRFIYEKW